MSENNSADGLDGSDLTEDDHADGASSNEEEKQFYLPQRYTLPFTSFDVVVWLHEESGAYRAGTPRNPSVELLMQLPSESDRTLIKCGIMQDGPDCYWTTGATPEDAVRRLMSGLMYVDAINRYGSAGEGKKQMKTLQELGFR